MPKNLKELAGDLKEYIIGLQSDSHNRGNIRVERYNNIKLVMDIAIEPRPHVEVVFALSSAVFDLKTGTKMKGGLGPEERYVLRWFERPTTLTALNECWKVVKKNRGKAYER